MADFPQSHTTHTTTTTTTTSGGRVHLDISYIKTIPGILRIVELVLCIIVFICAVSACSGFYGGSGACGWAGFVGFVGFLLVTAWLLFHLFHVYDAAPNVPWLLIEMIVYAAWTLFFLIAGIACAVAAADVSSVAYQHVFLSRYRDGNGAASFFSFVAAIVFGAQTFFLFRDWNSNRTSASRPVGHA